MVVIKGVFMRVGVSLVCLVAVTAVPSDDSLAEVIGRLRHPLNDQELQQLVEANELLRRNDITGAERLTSDIIKAHPADATVLSFVGVLADARKEPERAVAALESALLLEPNTVQLQLVLCQYYIAAGNGFGARLVTERLSAAVGLDEGERATLNRLIMETNSAKPALNALSRALAVGDLARAAAAIGLVIQYGAGSVLGQVDDLITRCEFRSALMLLDLAEERGSGGTAHFAFTRARVLRFLGEEKAAARAAQAALDLGRRDPTPVADGGIAIIPESLKQLGRYHEAFAHMREDFVANGPRKVIMNPGEGGGGEMSIFKLEHDAEQLLYLQALGVLNRSVPVRKIVAAYNRARKLMEKELASCGAASSTTNGAPHEKRRGMECFPVRHVQILPPLLASEMVRLLNQPNHYLPGAEWEGRAALNPQLDFGAIERAYAAGLAVIDDFLTEEALQELHKLGVQSTIWNQVKAGGYLGAFPREDGFAPPVVAQLALDLEANLPRIFRAHKLLMFWGFKHDTVRAPRGIKAHADTAAINLNFWVTPDVANRNPESGGLVVYRHREQSFRTFQQYNSYEVGEAELGLSPEDVLRRVPYRQNRAVLFSSTLYHATDTVEFQPGFETCRINYTLLFGFMEATRCARDPTREGIEGGGQGGAQGGVQGGAHAQRLPQMSAIATPTVPMPTTAVTSVCVDITGGLCKRDAK